MTGSSTSTWPRLTHPPSPILMQFSVSRPSAEKKMLLQKKWKLSPASKRYFQWKTRTCYQWTNLQHNNSLLPFLSCPIISLSWWTTINGVLVLPHHQQFMWVHIDCVIRQWWLDLYYGLLPETCMTLVITSVWDDKNVSWWWLMINVITCH